MSSKEELPKFPKWNPMKNDTWNIDRILEWNVKLREKLEKQIEDAKKEESNFDKPPAYRRFLRGYIKAKQEDLEALK